MLWRKLLRDLWSNKVQFISILLMAALSTYIYVGMASVWNGLQYARNEYYDKSNYADYIVSSSNGFTTHDIESLEGNKDIGNIELRYTVYDCIAYNEGDANITLHLLEEDSISKSVVIDGEKFDVNKDGIWLDYRFAKERKLKVGDSLELKNNGIEINRKIKGLVINPEYIYQVNRNSIIPDHETTGFAYMSYMDKGKLPLDKPNDLMIVMKNNKKLSEKELRSYTDNFTLFKRRSDILSHSMFSDAIKQYKAVGTIFPIAFLAVTVLTMLTTMTRLVDKQRIQIGTLGIMGLKRRKIYVHYLSFGFIPSFVGCMIGFVLGPKTLPYIYYETLENLYTMEYWKARLPYTSGVIVIACVGLCVLVTFSAIQKVLDETPAQAIKPKVASELENVDVFSSSILEKMSFGVRWNIVDIIKGKGRAIMTIIGILGCMGLLLAGFGLRDSLGEVIKLQYERIYQFKTKLSVDVDNKLLLNDNQYIVKKNHNDADMIYEGQIEIKANNIRKLSNIMVQDRIKHIKYIDNKNNSINLSTDKINISRKLAEVLNVRENDKLEFRLLGTDEYYEVTVGKIYMSPISQGITISKSMYQGLGYQFYANYALTTDRVGKNNKEQGVLNITSKKQLKKDYLTTRKTIDNIAFILMCSAMVLAVVVLYNLNILSLYERKNEFALLKVMGFKSKKIRNLLLMQTLILAAIGVLCGIPFGLSLLQSVLSSMGESLDIASHISIVSYLLSVLLTFGISVIMNVLFIFNIRNIDMVSSLKSE